MSKEYLKRRQSIRAAARKRKRVFAVILLILFVGVLVSGFFVRCLANSDKTYITYTVGYGDTLWSIARDIYGDSCDIRYKIDDIERENGIMNSVIYEGMELRICVSN